MFWTQTTWVTTLLPPRSQGSWSLMSWRRYLQTFWPQRRIFRIIYATWVCSHLEMVAWAAITPCLMIHFYISLTCHPHHQHFIGIFDYCYSHLNFSEDGGLQSKCSHALHGGYRLQRHKAAAGLDEEEEMKIRGTSWEMENLFPCNVSTKWSWIWWIAWL